jgi:hypothetical protein
MTSITKFVQPSAYPINEQNAVLPYELLQNIFSLLNAQDKQTAASVCRIWNDALLTLVQFEENRVIKQIFCSLEANIDEQKYFKVVIKIQSLARDNKIGQYPLPLSYVRIEQKVIQESCAFILSSVGKKKLDLININWSEKSRGFMKDVITRAISYAHMHAMQAEQDFDKLAKENPEKAIKAFKKVDENYTHYFYAFLNHGNVEGALEVMARWADATPDVPPLSRHLSNAVHGGAARFPQELQFKTLVTCLAKYGCVKLIIQALHQAHRHHYPIQVVINVMVSSIIQAGDLNALKFAMQFLEQMPERYNCTALRASDFATDVLSVLLSHGHFESHFEEAITILAMYDKNKAVEFRSEYHNRLI